jgi:hypothetical protein
MSLDWKIDDLASVQMYMRSVCYLTGGFDVLYTASVHMFILDRCIVLTELNWV